MKAGWTWAIAVGAALAISAGAVAGDAPIGEPSAAEVEEMKAAIEKLHGQLDETRVQAEDAAAEVRRIDLQAELAEREHDLAAAELDLMRREARTIDEELVRVEAQRSETLAQLAVRLSALYRLGAGGMVRLLLEPAAGDRFSEARLMAYLASKDRRLFERLSAAGRELEVRRQQRRATGEAMATLERRLAAKERELRDALARQRQIARTLRGQEASESKRLEELRDRTARLERVLELLAKSAGSLAGEDPRAYRGALAWPVSGVVAKSFGRERHDRFAVFVMNNGIEIDAEPGSAVVAVYPGRVRFARWMKGYGNMVIIDHGAKLLTVAAKLGGIEVAEGQDVTMGQRIAIVPPPAADEAAGIYFEIRDGKGPVDPVPWLRPRGGKE